MKLEQQVCSLELALKLKTLGVKQDSLFYWWGSFGGCGSPDQPFFSKEGYRLITVLDERCEEDILQHPLQDSFSAFTVAESMNMLQEIRKSNILILYNINVADYLAAELVKEYEKSNKV